MSLIAPVTDGQVNISESSQDTKEKKTGSSLDKDDFLQLLVTQMKYQDPLEPESNTEYVAQLAQFSELEQMENLNQTTVNTSAYSLVGKQVEVKEESETGSSRTTKGMVEYVTIQNGEPYVSVDGELYAYEDIVQVVDEAYLLAQYQPSVTEQNLTYMHWDPQPIVVDGIKLGSNGYQASGFAVVLTDEDGNTVRIPNEAMTYKEGKLTIDRSVFAGSVAGEYVLAFMFDDANTTMDYTSVKLTIKGNPEVAAEGVTPGTEQTTTEPGATTGTGQTTTESGATTGTEQTTTESGTATETEQTTTESGATTGTGQTTTEPGTTSGTAAQTSSDPTDPSATQG